MIGYKKRLLIFLLFVSSLSQAAAADPVVFMEFSDQPVRDVLICLGDYFEVSIVADETVKGNVSFHLRQADIRDALDALLNPLDLFYSCREGTYYVSALYIDYTDDTVTIHCEDAELSDLIKAFSRETGHTLIFSGLPLRKVSLHVEDVTIPDALSILASLIPGWQIENGKHVSYLLKAGAASRLPQEEEDPFSISRSEDGNISIQVQSAALKEVLDTLFSECGNEYVLFADPKGMLENIRYRQKSFKEMLGLVLMNAGAGFTVHDDLFVIFDEPEAEQMSRYRTVSVLPLQRLQAREIAAVLPPGILDSVAVCFDDERNLVLLHGLPAQVGRVRRVIEELEAAESAVRTCRYDLQHVTAEELLSNLPPAFDAYMPRVLTTGNAVLFRVPVERLSDVELIIAMIDTAPEVYPVKLRYIKAADLMKQPPPSAQSGQLQPGPRSDLVFFTGGKEQFELFTEEVALIDRPKPQIRYDILVIQYHESVRNEFNAALGVSPMEPGSATVFSTVAGGLLNLNFDIISTFGYRFALTLNNSVSASTAHILADTTLNGLCGNSIEFRNTDTYRYRDYEYDSESGRYRPGGIVREITSGLIIDLCGWMSGEGMITMDISLIVSKRGADVSSQTGNPPPTSEKRITTQVQTRSGRPVVIGGLIQRDESARTEKPGLIGEVPVVGPLLSSRTGYRESMEMAVYIVPHAEPCRDERRSVEEELLRLFKEFGGCFGAEK